MNAHLFQDVIEKLLKLHSSKKYILYDDIMDICDACNVPLTYTETILTEITDHGCSVLERIPTETELNSSHITDDSFESADYAHIDYEALYEEVLSVDPDLKTIIQYAREIRPAQHGEAAYIFKNQDVVLDSRKRLFDMNFRSVIKIAFQQFQLCEEELADLIQLGSIGLLNAIDKYDVLSETPFASYANSWIFQAISRGVVYRRNGCYFPVYIGDLLKQIERLASKHICSKCGGIQRYCPTLISQIQERYHLEYPMAKKFLSYIEPTISYEIIEEIIIQQEYFGYIEDYNEPSLDSNIEVYNLESNNPYEEYCRLDLKKSIDNIIASLSHREQEVIKYRFGFFDGREWTLEEVGGIYGVTRERIRQIELKAIRKIKNSARSKQINDFWT